MKFSLLIAFAVFIGHIAVTHADEYVPYELLNLTLRDKIDSHYITYPYRDKERVCFFQDWARRDREARAAGTFIRGRFSVEKVFMGMEIGKWFCYLTKYGARQIGYSLD